MLAPFFALAVACSSAPLPEDDSAIEPDADGTLAPDAETATQVQAITIDIVSSDRPLTEAPHDALFDLTLRASPISLPRSALKVLVGTSGNIGVELSCTHRDTNGNEWFEPGERMSCTESAINRFDQALRGSHVSVGLYLLEAGKVLRVSEGVWSPVR